MLDRHCIILYAASLWAPAFAPLISVTGLPLQITDIMIPFLGLIIWRQAHALSLAAWIIAAFLWIASASHVSPLAGHQVLWLWQISLPMMHVLLHAVIFAHPERIQPWFTSFHIGAWVSLMLAGVQIFTNGQIGDVRNNVAFSLPPQAHRGVALMPEVSTLSTFISIYIALNFAQMHQTGGRRPLISIIAGSIYLIFSGSKAAIIFCPILITSLILGRAERVGRKMLAIIIVALVAFGAFTTSLADRNSSGASEKSAQLRAATMLAALAPLTQGDVIGRGIGAQSNIATDAVAIARAHHMRFRKIPTGINSFIAAAIYEQGLLFVIVTTVTFAGLGVYTRSSDAHDTLLAWMGLWCWLASAMVIGYRGIYINWLPYAAIMALVSRHAYRARPLYTAYLKG